MLVAYKSLDVVVQGIEITQGMRSVTTTFDLLSPLSTASTCPNGLEAYGVICKRSTKLIFIYYLSNKHLEAFYPKMLSK